MTRKAKIETKVVDIHSTPEPEIQIRRAEPYDVVAVCKFLVDWLRSAAKHYPPAEQDAFTTWVLGCIIEGYVYIAERPNERRSMVGVAGMIAAQLPWNKHAFVYRDQFFYVPKAHRNLGVAKKLMTQLQIQASQEGVPLMMSIISGTNVERVDKWYGLSGNDYVGGNFVFGLPDKTGA